MKRTESGCRISCCPSASAIIARRARAEEIDADVRESQRDFARGSKLLLGMRCFTPEYADGAALIDKVRAARRMGVEDFRFYNYGLIPQSHLDWIREALQ